MSKLTKQELKKEVCNTLVKINYELVPIESVIHALPIPLYLIAYKKSYSFEMHVQHFEKYKWELARKHDCYLGLIGLDEFWMFSELNRKLYRELFLNLPIDISLRKEQERHIKAMQSLLGKRADYTLVVQSEDQLIDRYGSESDQIIRDKY